MNQLLVPAGARLQIPADEVESLGLLLRRPAHLLQTVHRLGQPLQ